MPLVYIRRVGHSAAEKAISFGHHIGMIFTFALPGKSSGWANCEQGTTHDLVQGLLVPTIQTSAGVGVRRNGKVVAGITCFSDQVQVDTDKKQSD